MDIIALPQSLFTVNDLSTLAGLVVAVYVIVSFLKEPLKYLAKGDWIVRPFTVAISMLILTWLIFIEGKVTLETLGLAVINSFLVAIIAGAAHDYIVAPTKSKIQIENLDLNQSLAQIHSAIQDQYQGLNPNGNLNSGQSSDSNTDLSSSQSIVQAASIGLDSDPQSQREEFDKITKS